MTPHFSNIAILGGGLLGGSLGLALAERLPPQKHRLWMRKSASYDEACALGMADFATLDLTKAVVNADMLVLAVPVGAMPDLVLAAIQAGLPDTCLITDVGSVKATPHRTIAPLLEGRGNRFIGSHPMAGSERNGLAAASSRLFDHAACLLTRDASTVPSQAAALEAFWQTLGCRTTWMDPAEHDRLVARISHMPHLLAASAARICLSEPSDGRFGGGGLRDTTRVAAGNPSMWAEIVMENRQALIPMLEESIADLREILASLENAEHENVQRWLAEAKQQRDPLNSIC
ncbi:MAG: prephenate dehydrogenase/arogenate dehydrogenase family protein [Verrucomicrobia bacterium]|nr:MAG: prephenate dehydrogenase/arogenate dehydrogenase family protein [Verrucomicrobiota bacterium]